MVNVVVVVLCGIAGMAVGWCGRRLLGGVPNGVQPPSPWCEIGVGVLWAMVAARTTVGSVPLWWAGVPALLAWLSVLLAGCDLRAARLPDVLTLPAYPAAGLALGFVAWASGKPALLGTAAVGSVLYASTYALVRWISPEAMGPGDVKLAGSLGAFAGAVSIPSVLASMVAAALLTLLLGLTGLLGWRASGGIPHGPAMLAPVWLVTAFPAEARLLGLG